jgi:hypothetical protein
MNGLPYYVFLYQDYDEHGKFVRFAPGESLETLTQVPIYNADGSYFGVNTFDNRTSSICVDDL